MNDAQRAPARLLTVSEVAEMLSVKDQTIYRWAADDKIPHRRLPAGHLRFDLGEITAWLEAGPAPTTEPAA